MNSDAFQDRGDVGVQFKERGWEKAFYLLLSKSVVPQLPDKSFNSRFMVFNVLFKLRPGDGLAVKVIVHIK